MSKLLLVNSKKFKRNLITRFQNIYNDSLVNENDSISFRKDQMYIKFEFKNHEAIILLDESAIVKKSIENWFSSIKKNIVFIYPGEYHETMSSIISSMQKPEVERVIYHEFLESLVLSNPAEPPGASYSIMDEQKVSELKTKMGRSDDSTINFRIIRQSDNVTKFLKAKKHDYIECKHISPVTNNLVIEYYIVE